jgi:hypothetical protein
MRTLAASASGKIGIQMKKQIQIFGTYKVDDRTDSFTGTVAFDEKENAIYYSWTLLNKDGKSTPEKSLSVTFEQIPSRQDRFEFTKVHAIEGIRKYRN